MKKPLPWRIHCETSATGNVEREAKFDGLVVVEERIMRNNDKRRVLQNFQLDFFRMHVNSRFAL